MNLKQFLKPFIPDVVLSVRRRIRESKPLFPRSCPICGYHGYFETAGRPILPDARCPKCASMERHRQFWLWHGDAGGKLLEPILHFAPEPCLRARLKTLYKDYKTADLFEKDVDLKLNIEDTGLEAGSIGTVICNHVLEHVDDRKALRELYRILSDGGLLICSVPIVEGWAHTYENEAVKTPKERELHFGQSDHLRYYGRDFRDRLREAGFTKFEEVTAEGQDVLDYGLIRGDKLFLCRKA